MSKFKIRYQNDDEFREAHLAYIKERIQCKECGRYVTRNNMTRHRKSNLHKKNIIETADISKFEKHKKTINRIYDKKIRAIERELDEIERKIQKKLAKG
jgi:hypothetical protein